MTLQRWQLAAGLGVTLFVVGTLSSFVLGELSDLISLSPIYIYLGLAVLVGLAIITTIIMARLQQGQQETFAIGTPNIRITQYRVRRVGRWLMYIPAMLMLMVGVYHLSQTLVHDWTKWLETIVVSIPLLIWPEAGWQDNSPNKARKELFVAWLLSGMYGVAGLVLLSNPTTQESTPWPYIVISAITMIGIRLSFGIYLMSTSIIPWFSGLPEK